MTAPQFDLGAMLSAPAVMMNSVQQIPCDQLHPYQRNDGLTNTVVSRVEVLKLNSESFGYNFLTTTAYNGLPFDRTNSGEVRHTNEKSENYNYVISIGTMVQSDEVDYVNGIARSHTIQNETKYNKIIAFEAAARLIKDYLTSEVTFEIQKAELVYCSKNPDAPYASVEEALFTSFPSWKFTLFNSNDNLTYVCYIDAIDGENLRYYTISEQEW